MWTPFCKWVAAEEEEKKRTALPKIFIQKKIIHPTASADVIILITRLYHNPTRHYHKYRTKYIQKSPTIIHYHTRHASNCFRCAQYSTSTSAYSFTWILLQYSLLPTVSTTESITELYIGVMLRSLFPPSTEHGGKEKNLDPTTQF